jgi:hypothetical protein
MTRPLAFSLYYPVDEHSTLPNTVEDDHAIPHVLVCKKTAEFRRAARFWDLANVNVVLEIGCSFGLTSLQLGKRYTKVIATDISPECIQQRTCALDNVEFLVIDALLAKDEVVELCIANKVSAIWMDIGGDRNLHAVVLLLGFLLEKLPLLRFVVCKSEKLYVRCVQSNLFALGSSAIDDNGWFANLHASCYASEKERKKLKHPQKYSLRFTESGLAICRYHNYEYCKKQELCPFDHTTCHFCGEAGHRALECEKMLGELVIGPFRTHKLRSKPPAGKEMCM